MRGNAARLVLEVRTLACLINLRMLGLCYIYIYIYIYINKISGL
jgi:hypothetical protein